MKIIKGIWNLIIISALNAWLHIKLSDCSIQTEWFYGVFFLKKIYETQFKDSARVESLQISIQLIRRHPSFPLLVKKHWCYLFPLYLLKHQNTWASQAHPPCLYFPGPLLVLHSHLPPGSFLYKQPVTTVQFTSAHENLKSHNLNIVD